MLSMFPELLFLAPFAAFVIRVVAGITVGLLAYRHLKKPITLTRFLGILEGVIAILLIAGAYTQPAALLGFVVILVTLFIPSYREMPRSALALLSIMVLSLIVTGAGPFAFDLPL